MKTFGTDVVLSLTTGILLKEKGFGEMQDLCEYIAGHPVWTHELADKAFVNKLVEAVFEQHPQLREAETWDAGDKQGADMRTYLRDYVSRQMEKFGTTLEIKPGSMARTENPLESFQRIAGDIQSRKSN
jgi:hypothetical protein